MAREPTVFMSYAYGSTAHVADLVERRLRKLGRKWHSTRALRVHRDTSSLAANEDLWGSIADTIDHSEHFLLLASEDAANSEWVAREVTRFLDSRAEREGDGRFLIGVADGSVAWSADGADIDWERTTALPELLRGHLPAEPLFVDLTDLDLDDPHPETLAEFDRRIARLSAGFLDTTPAEVLRGHDTQRRRFRRIVTAGALAVITAISVAAVLSWQLSTELAARSSAASIIENEMIRFERIRDEPIRRVSVHLRPETLPTDGVALALQIEFDPLFSRPMLLYVASFDPGRPTWPPTVELAQPVVGLGQLCTSNDYAAGLVWYDQDIPVIGSIGLAADPWTYAAVEFDGGEFDPEGTLVLPQTRELPPFADLERREDVVTLWEIPPDGSDPVPSTLTEVDIQLWADFGEGSFALFRSQHTPEQELALGTDVLFNRNRVEQEALLSLYEDGEAPKGTGLHRAIMEAYRSGESPGTAQERVLHIRAALDSASSDLISAGEGPLAAVRHFEDAIALAGAIPLDDITPAEAESHCLAVLAHRRLVEQLTEANPIKVTNLLQGAQRAFDVIEACSGCHRVRQELAWLYHDLALAVEEVGEDPALAQAALDAMVSEAAVVDAQIEAVSSANTLLAVAVGANTIASRIGLDAPADPQVQAACERSLASPDAGFDADATSQVCFGDWGG